MCQKKKKLVSFVGNNNPNLFVKSFAVQIISFVTSKIGSKKYLQNYNPIQRSLVVDVRLIEPFMCISRSI